LSHQLSYLSSVIVHVDPAQEAGEEFHHVHEHPRWFAASLALAV
jgi:hypothetical protein